MTLTEEKRVSQNGIPVYLYENRALHGFCISMFVRAGVIYENEDNEGAAHFLEHVAIRNLNAVYGGTLYEKLDALGMELTASTYHEMIQFSLVGSRRYFAEGAKILSNLLSPLVLSKADVDTERARIKAEIRESDERDTLSYFSAKTLFDGTPLAYSILGTNKSVDAMSARKLEVYRRFAMSEGNVYFVVTGNVCAVDLDVLLEAVSDKTVYPGVKREAVIQKPTTFGNRGGAVYVKSADYTVLRFQFDMDMTKLTVPVTDMLYDVMFTGNSSLFFTELSEKRGLCYDISGSVDRYINIGSFSFTVEVKKGDVDEVVKLTVALLNRLKSLPLPKEKMPYAPYVDNAGMLADDMTDTNFTFGYEKEILNLPYHTLSERSLAYACVTPEDLQNAAKILFTKNNGVLTVKGEKKRLDTERLSFFLSSLENA